MGFFKRQVTLPVWALLIGGLVLLGLGSASAPKDDTAEVAATDTTTTVATEEPTTSAPTTAATTAPPTTAAATTTTAAKRWTEVATASGSAEKRTGNFRLSGGETRMRYTSKAGFFAVYVMEAGTSLEQSGGFPEVTCTEPCGDETRLAKSRGDYYLEVKASGGTWSVVIEELR